MQKLLIKIITSNGGSCPFQNIIDEVSKSSTKLKRRDGTHYSSDSVRAVKASLSNNTYSIPIFKRDPNVPDCWQVADKMFIDAVVSEDEQRTKRKPEEEDMSEEKLRNSSTSEHSSEDDMFDIDEDAQRSSLETLSSRANSKRRKLHTKEDLIQK